MMASSTTEIETGRTDSSEVAMKPCPRVESLEEYTVPLAESIQEYLTSQYARHYSSLATFNGAENTSNAGLIQARAHLERYCQRLKVSPRQTVLRLTSIHQTPSEIVPQIEQNLQEWMKDQQQNIQQDKSSSPSWIIQPVVQSHSELAEVITIDFTSSGSPRSEDHESIISSSHRRIPLHKSKTNSNNNSLSWPDPLKSQRERQGWPLSHRVVIVDRFCAEAVLRGADIFVKGILAADAGIRRGEEVVLYGHLSDHHDNNKTMNNTATITTTTRGMLVQQYGGHAVSLGMGTAQCDRAQFFSQSTGVGVQVSATHRAGPVLPPLHLFNSASLYPQNLPSVLVGHFLDPQPGDVVYDMCGAPGGKTSHLALRSHGKATIVMSDKSRKKVLAAKQFFDKLGYSKTIYPLHVDTTKCVNEQAANGVPSVPEVLSNATASPDDGLLNVTHFPPESFDKILLDPPCSALGLRPKLQIPQKKPKELTSHANYQKRFIRQAVRLLKPGGFMTFSTCTIHAMENEANVRFLLDEFPCMELVPLDNSLGGHPGLAGFGLNEEERRCVLRFDSFVDISTTQVNGDNLAQDDVMGFFIAKFRKKTSLK